MPLDAIRHDLVSGLRGLARTPAVTATAVLTLALGLGAATALFTVAKAVVLAPLPYADPGSRVMLWSRWVSFDKTWLSELEVLDYRRQAATLRDVAAWSTGAANLTGDGDAQRVGVGQLTANTFDVLGARPLLGRGLTPGDDLPGAAPVAVLGHRLWQTRYGGDPAVVGRRITLDDRPVEVVGVMPEGFRLPTDFTEDAADPTELWQALPLDPATAERGAHGLYAAAVLAPGATAVTASDELARITADLTAQGLYPQAMRFSAFATPFEDEVRGPVRQALLLLGGAVACLLLVACANVANLLLVRGDGRVREIAVRTALGATADRLLRQLLAESLLLGVTSAALGLGVAAAAVRTLLALDPASVPPLMPIGLDLGVVAFAAGLAIVTTLLFGLLPALRARRVHLVEALRDGGPQATAGVGRHRLRAALVIAEMTMAVVLVVGAGLMARTLGALGRVPLGFSPAQVLTMRFSLPEARYDSPERVSVAVRRLLEDVRAVPGVRAAGLVRALPLATTIGDWGLDIEGYEEAPGRIAKGDWQVVTDGAFEAMGTRLARGRWFTPADTAASQPVMVVNETMARTYWPEGRALGGRVRVGSDAARPEAIVVGIVADERHNGVTAAPKEKFYVPHAQWPVVTGGNVIRSAFLVLRSDGDPRALAGPVRAAVRRLDVNVPVSAVRTMEDVVATSLATPRLTGVLLGAFAGTALLLAAVGLYGVQAFVVARRTHEFGIRLAVGAGRGDVLRLVLRQGLALALTGLGCGLALAAGATRLMQGLLYGVAPLDPLTFTAVPLVLLTVAVLASLVPALRAVRVNPTVALRID
ncbi:MAG: ABC transporter permease [Vicinamibacterales bacterium]